MDDAYVCTHSVVMIWAITQIARLLLLGGSRRGIIFFLFLVIISWRNIVLATILNVFFLILILATVRSRFGFRGFFRLLATFAILSTFAHSKLTLQLCILSLQVLIVLGYLLQLSHSFTHCIIGLQESLNGLKKILYLLLILLPFHIRHFSTLYRRCLCFQLHRVTGLHNHALYVYLQICHYMGLLLCKGTYFLWQIQE